MGEALRKTLRELVKLCNDAHGTITSEVSQEIGRLLSGVSIGVLGIRLPHPNPALSLLNSSIYTCDIHWNPSMTVSVFGFKHAGDKIPLHDHPHIFGYIRMLRGGVKIRSYSILPLDEQYNALLGPEQKCSDLYNRLPVKYEGECSISVPSDDNDVSQIGIVEPKKGNIHEVVALADGSAFVDVLVPGYKSPESCIYYKELSPSTPNVGDIVFLQHICPPDTYYTEYIDYEALE